MRNGRTDRNQTEIVKVLRSAKCDVLVNSNAANGIPDLIVWSPYLGATILMEVKDGLLPPSRRKLSQMQIKVHRTWSGLICVVKNVDEALGFAGVPRNTPGLLRSVGAL